MAYKYIRLDAVNVSLIGITHRCVYTFKVIGINTENKIYLQKKENKSGHQ